MQHSHIFQNCFLFSLFQDSSLSISLAFQNYYLVKNLFNFGAFFFSLKLIFMAFSLFCASHCISDSVENTNQKLQVNILFPGFSLFPLKLVALLLFPFHASDFRWLSGGPPSVGLYLRWMDELCGFPLLDLGGLEIFLRASVGQGKGKAACDCPNTRQASFWGATKCACVRAVRA